MAEQQSFGKRKTTLSCAVCRKSLAPKEGDWFWSPDSKDQQFFLCKACEHAMPQKPKAVTRK